MKLLFTLLISLILPFSAWGNSKDNQKQKSLEPTIMDGIYNSKYMSNLHPAIKQGFGPFLLILKRKNPKKRSIDIMAWRGENDEINSANRLKISKFLQSNENCSLTQLQNLIQTLNFKGDLGKELKTYVDRRKSFDERSLKKIQWIALSAKRDEKTKKLFTSFELNEKDKAAYTDMCKDPMSLAKAFVKNNAISAEEAKKRIRTTIDEQIAEQSDKVQKSFEEETFLDPKNVGATP